MKHFILIVRSCDQFTIIAFLWYTLKNTIEGNNAHTADFYTVIQRFHEIKKWINKVSRYCIK